MLHPDQRQHKEARLQAAIKNRPRPEQKAEVGSRTKFRAAVDAVRLLSTEHRHYLAKQSVPPTHHHSRPSGPSQQSGGKGATWASSRVNAAYIKAVYVASFSKGAETAQKRREQQESLQQQHHSTHPQRAASPAVKGPACSWPKADHEGVTTSLVSSVEDGGSCSWSKEHHSGEPLTSRKMASCEHPAAELSTHSMHSRRSSPDAEEASSSGPGHSMHSRPNSGRNSKRISIESLSRRPSTVAGHTRHARPDSLAHTKRPATVDAATLQALKLAGGVESPVGPHLGRPGAKLDAKSAKDLVVGGQRSLADVELFMPHSPMCQIPHAKSPLKDNSTWASDADTQNAAVQHQKQQQVIPTMGSVPVWKEHLFREKDLYDAVEQSKADYTASSPMCHPLLLAVEGV
ncbi:hypothetical protein WJX79_000827 [Trebouxia sp. C0005]